MSVLRYVSLWGIRLESYQIGRRGVSRRFMIALQKYQSRSRMHICRARVLMMGMGEKIVLRDG